MVPAVAAVAGAAPPNNAELAALVAFAARVAVPAEVAVFALPLILIPYSPLLTCPELIVPEICAKL